MTCTCVVRFSHRTRRAIEKTLSFEIIITLVFRYVLTSIELKIIRKSQMFQHMLQTRDPLQ